MKICSSCGSQMPDEAYTCSFCGTPLQASQDSQPPYVSQPYDPSYQQAGYYQPPFSMLPRSRTSPSSTWLSAKLRPRSRASSEPIFVTSQF